MLVQLGLPRGVGVGWGGGATQGFSVALGLLTAWQPIPKRVIQVSYPKGLRQKLMAPYNLAVGAIVLLPPHLTGYTGPAQIWSRMETQDVHTGRPSLETSYRMRSVKSMSRGRQENSPTLGIWSAVFLGQWAPRVGTSLPGGPGEACLAPHGQQEQKASGFTEPLAPAVQPCPLRPSLGQMLHTNHTPSALSRGALDRGRV